MTIRDEAERRYRDDVDVETGEPVDDWGYSECARRAFEAGAEFARSGIAASIRDEKGAGNAFRDVVLERAARVAHDWQPAGGPESTSGDVDREAQDVCTPYCDGPCSAECEGVES